MVRRLKLGLKILLVIFWVGGGINHFLSPEFYLNIMPDYLPMHEELVFLSGVTEIIAGILVAIPRTTKYGVWFIYAHLFAFMPVHIYMLQYASTRYAEVPVAILWLRLPLQALFAYWAYWCTREDEAKENPVEVGEAPA